MTSLAPISTTICLSSPTTCSLAVAVSDVLLFIIICVLELRELLDGIFMYPGETDRQREFVASAKDDAERLFSGQPWRAVVAKLADVLFRNRELSGEEAGRLVDEICG